FLSFAPSPPPTPPCDTDFPLCVGLVLDGPMFSLVCALPSPISAEDCSSLFDRFTGTMAQSDSSEACLSAVRHEAFSDRSRLWLGREDSEVSRFSCMLFLSVPGSQTTQGWLATRDNAANHVAFPLRETVGDPDPIPFRSSIARPTNALVYASTETSRRQSQDSGSRWSSLSPFL